MIDTSNSAADNSSGVAADATVTAPVVAKAAPTKAEKIAKLEADIKKLQERLYNVVNDIATVARVKPVVALPAVGDTVLFSYGRKTLTTSPVLREGVVAAIKPAAAGTNGKTIPAMIKVQCGEGFDAEFVTIYAGSIVPAGTTQADVDAEDDAS